MAEKVNIMLEHKRNVNAFGRHSIIFKLRRQSTLAVLEKYSERI